MSERKAVLITTSYKGVFFGYVADTSNLPKSIEVFDCRNCLEWSNPTKGFLGLATIGPDKDCRVGPAAEVVTLYDITCVANVTDKAAEEWRKAPWR